MSFEVWVLEVVASCDSRLPINLLQPSAIEREILDLSRDGPVHVKFGDIDSLEK